MFRLAKRVALTYVTLTLGVGLIVAVYTAPWWVPNND